MGIRVEPGATDISVYFYIVGDAGDAAPGDAKTGLANANINNAAHVRDRAVAVTFSTSALGSPSAAHTDGGFIEVNATTAPGLYRLDLPDAAVASGVDRVQISLELTGASNARTEPIVIELDSVVLDALTVDTIAELAQAQPPTTPTMVQALMLLYMAVRDKLETTGSEQRIHNDAGTVIAKSALTFASGTFTRDKLASGP